MKTRIVTAFIGFLIAIVAITMGGYVYDFILTILALKGWAELCRMLKANGLSLPKAYGSGAIALIMVALSLGFYPLAGTFLALAYFTLWMRFTFSNGGVSIGDMAFSCFGLTYISLGFGALLLLRQEFLLASLQVPLDGLLGASLILWLLLFTTWASDTFAYFAGVAFGKHKIVPHISPNKTAEGYLGGFVGCIMTGWIFACLFGLPYQMGLTFGVLAGLLAPLGDLFESKLKRTCGVKDSGTLLPGHGGVLDRFDSLLLTGPAIIFYLFLIA